LYDLQEDPTESKNLLYEPEHRARAREMETQLYAMMDELGGMEIPLNAPMGGSQNKRLRSRNGDESADFPDILVLDKPVNVNAQ
jgi:N-acetylglucosamine-6-sulfatase